eukprot:2824416-Prymnesium_polylepis.1
MGPDQDPRDAKRVTAHGGLKSTFQLSTLDTCYTSSCSATCADAGAGRYTNDTKRFSGKNNKRRHGVGRGETNR